MELDLALDHRASDISYTINLDYIGRVEYKLQTERKERRRYREVRGMREDIKSKVLWILILIPCKKKKKKKNLYGCI